MGATIGTRFMTWWKGKLIGEDEFGNRYFQDKNGPRRWVIYAGRPEASAVPADWHGWLHKTVEHPPVGDHRPKQPEFGIDHQANPTGTVAAQFPAGSMNEGGKRQGTSGDYEAWSPEN
jgi:NADH:ubiquinone oxidoreductase subunit